MEQKDKLIQTIRQQNIRPLPKGYFILKKALVLALFAVTVLLGALAFAVILFSIQQTDFELLAHIKHSRLEFFLAVLPFFWIAALAGFTLAAMAGFRHTAKGYKFTTARLAGYSAALSILLGTLVFLAGGARRFERAFDIRVSLYESVQEKKIKIWSMPDAGYLSGTVETSSDSAFHLKDFNGRVWAVCYGDSAFIAPVVLIEPGEKVKIIGKLLQEGQFRADEIRPWGGPGTRMRRRGGQD